MTFFSIYDTKGNEHIFNPTKIKQIYIRSFPEKCFKYLIIFADSSTWELESYEPEMKVSEQLKGAIDDR